jgi:nucleoside-diphosphate-sugar epimerase
MTRVLVTGGTGYIGGWAIVALLQRDYDVRTTVRSSSREQAVIDAVSTEVEPGERLSFGHADLTQDDGWEAAMDGVDYVLHVASPLGEGGDKKADELIVPARDGALRVLRAATGARVKRVVMTSAANAASPMSYTTEGVTDETLWTVDDPSLPAYRRSKTIAETTSARRRSSSACSAGRCAAPPRSAWRSSTSATSSTSTSAP